LKRFGVFAILFSLAVSLFPGVTYAGGNAAAICVRYVIVDQYGSYETYKYDPSYSYADDYNDDGIIQGDGLTQTVTGPDGTGNTLIENYWTPDYHYNIKPTAGTYTLTDIVYPDGYELDKAATAIYPLSRTITAQDVKDYKKWVSDALDAGTQEYTIFVPIKKTGTTSALYKKPAKETIKAEKTTINNKTVTALRFNGGNWITAGTDISLQYEIQYSTKKTGTYKKLCSNTDSDYLSLSECKKVKNKKTYYFKVRAVKKIGKKTINGSWSTAKKVTVRK
jgi:hypothetical protein